MKATLPLIYLSKQLPLKDPAVGHDPRGQHLQEMPNGLVQDDRLDLVDGLRVVLPTPLDASLVRQVREVAVENLFAP